MAGFFRNRKRSGSDPVRMTDGLRECLELVGQAEDAMHAAFGREMFDTFSSDEGSGASMSQVVKSLSELDGELCRLALECDRLVSESGASYLRGKEELTGDEVRALGQCIDGLLAQRNVIEQRYNDLCARYVTLLRAVLTTYEHGVPAKVQDGMQSSLTLLSRAYSLL